MGTESSKHAPAPRAAPAGRSLNRNFTMIADNYQTLEQVQAALRQNGLESSNLIVAVDFTKSNEWTGRNSNNNQCLHHLGPVPNPYEQAISIIAKTLQAFDDDGLIPAIGFGDATTQDTAVFNFFPGGAPAHGLEQLVARYRQLAPHVRLAGPTSFAPAIYQAMKIVADSGNQYHILVIIADGQVTRPSDLSAREVSRQEQATINAIVSASALPLSIIMVGVGDGPWDVMQDFDDKLPNRRWDNFQFVNFTDIVMRYANDQNRMEAMFALRALMEVPEQFKIIQRQGLLGCDARFNTNVRCLPPPGPAGPTLASIAAAPPPSYASGPSYGPSYPSMTPLPAAPAPAPVPVLVPPVGPPGAAVDPLFVCPITTEIMADPVMAADGYTYDRQAIARWLEGHETSPMTNAPLAHKQLTPNHALRSSIMEFTQPRK